MRRLYKKHLPDEIENGKVNIENNLFDWKTSITYPYGRSFAKLYAAIHKEDVNNYRELALKKWDGSEVFKLNLYPIALDSTDETLWHKHKLDRITGFDEKHLFQTWCFMNRFPAFSEIRSQKRPKLIICTGLAIYVIFLCVLAEIKKVELLLSME